MGESATSRIVRIHVQRRRWSSSRDKYKAMCRSLQKGKNDKDCSSKGAMLATDDMPNVVWRYLKILDGDFQWIVESLDRDVP